MDKARTEDPKETKEFKEVVLGSDVVAKIVNRLRSKGYCMVGHLQGKFSGFRVFRKSTDLLPGLNVPEDFYMWQEVQPEDELARGLFLATYRGVLEDMLMAESNAGVYNVLAACLVAMVDRYRDPKNYLVELSRSQWGNCAEIERVTLNGLSGYTKVVPLREWFPECLQGYDSRELLTLFPDAEAEQLMLILGRLVAGAKGTVTAEGTLEHTARSFALIVGTQAGMGKSTLMTYIRSALTNLGFRVEMLNTDFDRFGWGRVAVSDLGFVDDLTDDTQAKLIKSEKVKSIVSGDVIKAQEKGEHSYDTRCTAVILGCTNVTNYSHYLGLDEGSINRLNQLYTFQSWEMDENLGTDRDYRILPFWRDEAERLGVTTDVLAAWLLRQSLDKFLDVTGHTFNSEGMLVKNYEADRLEETIKANRDRFVIDVSLKHVEELVQVCLELTALAIAEGDPRKRSKYLAGFDRMDFSPNLVLAILNVFVARPDQPDPWGLLNLRHLSWECRGFLKAKLSDFNHLAPSKSLDAAFRLVIGELKSRKGFGYPGGIASYTSPWMAKKVQMTPRLRYWEEVLEANEVPEDLGGALTSIQKILEALA